MNPTELLGHVTFNRLLTLLAIGVCALVILRLSDALWEGLSRRVPRARLYFKVVAPVVRFGTWAITGLLVIAILAPSTETMLAILASAGIALGFGAQDLVKNLIGGVVILTDRPYQIGDRVKIGDAYGEIDHIGLRSTKLTTPDDTRVTIPNSQILNGQAWNASSGDLDCLVVTLLYVPHDARPREAIEVAYEAAYSSPYIQLSKSVVVNLEDRFLDGPFMIVRVKAYVYDHRFEGRFQSDITVRAKEEYLRRGMILKWNRHDPGPPSEELRQEFYEALPVASGADVRHDEAGRSTPS